MREAITKGNVSELFIKDEQEKTESEPENCIQAAEEVSGDYIYFPEYDLKLKKSKKLDHYAWRVEDSSDGDGIIVYIVAQPAGLDEAREYVNIAENSFGAATIRKNSGKDGITDETLGYQDDDVEVYYSGSQSAYLSEGSAEEQDRAREEVMKMLEKGFSRI